MYSNRSTLQIEIVVFNRTMESIPEIEVLEAQLIREIKPIWNNHVKE